MPQRSIRLADLRNSKVKTLDGEILGRVHEIHAEDGRIIALICGARSFIEQLTAKSRGQRIAWERVVKLGKGLVLVTPDPPRRKSGGKR